MMQRNVEAGHDLCMRINRAQNASIPSPLRAGGSASADHGVRVLNEESMRLLSGLPKVFLFLIIFHPFLPPLFAMDPAIIEDFTNITINSRSSRVTPSESPEFWNNLIINPKLPISFRRNCVFSLFRRHIKIGMTLDQMGKVLMRPELLKEKDLLYIWMLSGWIPVDENCLADANFVLGVLPVGSTTSSAIYFSFSGDITRNSFCDAICFGGSSLDDREPNWQNDRLKYKDRELEDYGLHPCEDNLKDVREFFEFFSLKSSISNGNLVYFLSVILHPELCIIRDSKLFLFRLIYPECYKFKEPILLELGFSGDKKEVTVPFEAEIKSEIPK